MAPAEQDQDALSLEQIEDKPWGDPPADATTLVSTVHRLRRAPVGSLGPEDLRVLVAQQVGIQVLVPRVLTLLEREPLLEADYYPGDVLVAVLRVPAPYWAAHPTQLARVDSVLASIEEPDAELADDIAAFRDKIRAAAPKVRGTS